MLLKNKKFVISAAADGIGFAISKLIVENGGIVKIIPLTPGVSTTSIIEKRSI